MAAGPIDPSTCLTASEAFKYPLPQVRQFHRSLTAELDEKNARLRSLVGGSYRQLLGTAETILQMRDDITRVEDKLGKVGAGCGRGWIGGIGGGLVKIQETRKEGKHQSDLEWLARAKALNMCEIIVGRLLRKRVPADPESKNTKGEYLILAAKVLVLSRLLSKSLSTSASPMQEDGVSTVEQSRKKLEVLRRRLLRIIQKSLERIGPSTSPQDLLQPLAAHSLATSSGAKDVLRHFLRVRAEAMLLALENEDGQTQQSAEVLRALELYFQTLIDVQALVPRRLSEALAALKAKPLLGDQAVRALDGLRLDTCEQWFGDEISVFTPYVRHDDLAGVQGVELLKSWAAKAEEEVLKGLTRTLGQMTEIKKVVELRTKALETCIREGGKVKGFDPSDIIDSLREVVNDRMFAIVESRVSKLHLVSTEIEATLASWEVGTANKYESPWSEAMLNTEINNGGVVFKQAILARTNGRNDAISRALGGYKTWRHLVEELLDVLEHLRKQRWDDGLEAMEDDDILESISNLLRVEDPKNLHDHLNSSLEKAYKELDDKMTSLVALYKDDDHIGQMSVYVLRVIREIRLETPQAMSLGDLGLSLVKVLHQTIATMVAKSSIEVLLKSFDGKKVAGRALWEGTPPSPVQPSPGVYRFLHGLASSMGEYGGDLWSQSAISALKKHIRLEVGLRGSSKIAPPEEKKPEADSNESPADGELVTEAETNGNEEKKNEDILIQHLFDISVLQSVLKLPKKDSKDAMDLFEAAIQEQSDIENALVERLGGSAKEYWSRTSLLFGPL